MGKNWKKTKKGKNDNDTKMTTKYCVYTGAATRLHWRRNGE